MALLRVTPSAVRPSVPGAQDERRQAMRGPLRRAESDRCDANIRLQDGTSARCQRRAVIGQRCRQHAAKILQSGLVHDNLLIMRAELGRHFLMKDLQDLSLLYTCKLYIDLKRSERKS